MKLLCSYLSTQDEKMSFKDRVIFDDDIDHTQIKSTASGGYEIRIFREDEFGNEEMYRVIIEKTDVILLEGLKEKQLI